MYRKHNEMREMIHAIGTSRESVPNTAIACVIACIAARNKV